MNTFGKLTITTVLVLLLAAPAYPQNRDIVAMEKDIIDLKSTLNQLQDSMNQKNQAILSLVEQMSDQMNKLAANVDKINQTVENVNSHTDKSATDIRGLVATLNTRLSELSDSVNAIRSQLGSVSQQMTSMNTQPLPGPDDSWRSANLDVIAGNYDLALQELSDFQNKYPNDPRAAKAQLFKGDALVGEKKYEQAVIEYDTFLQKYPENEDTKAALYKKGLAQAEYDPKAAVATLQQVVAKYKGSLEAQNAQAKLKELAPSGRRPGGTRPDRHN